MRREVVERAARGHDVDEAEERRAQLVVAGRQPHRLAVERLHRVAGRGREGGCEAAPDRLDLPLDRRLVRHAPKIPAISAEPRLGRGNPARSPGSAAGIARGGRDQPRWPRVPARPILPGV